MSIEIRALRENELQVHDRLIWESYHEYAEGERDFLEGEGWWLEHMRRDPYYSPEQTQILLADGEMVASVSSFRREMHCAGRIATVGAIGSVATHPDHRRRGYVRRLLAESRRWMLDNEFDFSFLFGSPDVYGGSGWEMLSGLETVAAVRTPTDDLGLTIRKADFDHDIPALRSIYDEFNRPLTGTFLRSEAYWDKRVPGGYFHDRTPEFHIVEQDGEPVAYYRSGEAGSVSEIGWRRGDSGLPSRVVGAILRQWPEAMETRFALCTRELLSALAPFIWAPTAADCSEKQSCLRPVENSKGLWTHIGPGKGEFPEVSDTASLLGFLREHEYTFWRGVDSF